MNAVTPPSIIQQTGRYDRFRFLVVAMSKRPTDVATASPFTSHEDCNYSNDDDNECGQKADENWVVLLNNRGIGDDGAAVVAAFLSRSSLYPHTMLRVWGSNIHDDGAVSLARALSVNDTLQILDLRVNHIGDRGVIGLAEALKRNHTLKRLVLRRNMVGDAGAHAIGQALCSNTTLEQLDLGNNKITSVGIYSIAAAIAQGQSSALTGLRLSFNRIDDHGVTAIADALLLNRTVETLFLSYNPFGNVGIEALVKVLEVNTSLMNVSVGGRQQRIIPSSSSLLLSTTTATTSATSTTTTTTNSGAAAESAQQRQQMLLRCLEFYQLLNRLAFRKVFRSYDGALWPHILSSSRMRNDLIYLLLRNKPDIVKRET